jgi:NAD(P)-dependent dehydrogenase (short-subunit alcohol dehydrogenase family)
VLERKSAIIYGGGGAIGGAVAPDFAREGARVFLVGRTLARLEEVAQRIRADGGSADVAPLDALDEAAVDAHADSVAAQAGSIEHASMLKRAATLEDVAHVAAFVASDRARTMTATTVNISAGALID